MTKKLLKMALDALEDERYVSRYTHIDETIIALRLAIDVQNMASESTYKEALAQPEHHPQHSHTLQEMYAELHLYEEINEHYALCNPGAANLRDWVAERMDKPVQPVGRFAKFTDGVWREVTDGSAGVALYLTPPKQLKERNS